MSRLSAKEPVRRLPRAQDTATADLQQHHSNITPFSLAHSAKAGLGYHAAMKLGHIDKGTHTQIDLAILERHDVDAVDVRHDA